MANNVNLRSRCIRLLLYPDNSNHCDALEKIKSYDYYAYILHDKDEVENDIDDVINLKKPHWHVVLKFTNPRYTHAICDELGIEYRFCLTSGSLKQSLLYLVHYNMKDYKHEYDLDEVHGTLRNVLEKYVQNENDIEDERIIKIVSQIQLQHHRLKTTELLKWACENGLYSDFRRGYSIIRDVIIEHNEKYINFNINEED